MFLTIDDLKAHMRRHAKVLWPKFKNVLDEFDSTLADTGVARWNSPKGGYFISLYVLPGCAKRVYGLCNAVGLTLTAAGAAYPYGKDPEDSNLRIAPTYPDAGEVKIAAEILSVAVRYAALEKLISSKE